MLKGIERQKELQIAKEDKQCKEQEQKE